MGLEVKNAATERPELWVYGPIGADFGGITDKEFADVVTEIPSQVPITVRLNSQGGVFSDAAAIHSILTRRKGDVHVIVEGRAYSAGSIIAMAGKTIEMARGAWMMCHEAMGTINDGQAWEFRQRADKLDEINAQIRSFYKPRWKKSEGELIEAMAKTLWMKDEAAVALGMADSVTEDYMAVAAYVDVDRFGYKNAPDEVAKAVDLFPNIQKRADKIRELGAIA
jgi:ATP-dependent protease ClpP protease subunit